MCPQKRALIVEDNPTDQKRFQSLLESRSIYADIVDSALEARSKLRERNYLLVILDLDLGTGIDEGKFLLDTMFQENIHKPTIIMSYAGLQPETVVLRSRYKFIKTSIDKKHLHEMLSLFDDAIKEIIESHGDLTERQSEILANKPALWGNLLALLLALVVIVGIVVGAARLVSPWLLSLVLVSVIILFLLLGTLVLKLQNGLSEVGFLDIAGKIIKSLPLLRKVQYKKKRRIEN